MQKWLQLSDQDQRKLLLAFFEVTPTPTLRSEFEALLDSVEGAWCMPGFKSRPLVKVNVLMHLAMMSYVNQATTKSRLAFPRNQLDWVVEEFDQQRRYKLVVYAKHHPVLLWRQSGELKELAAGQLGVVCDRAKQLGARVLRNAETLAHKVPAVSAEFYT